MKGSDIVKVLEKNRELMQTLAENEINGFAVIMAPGGDPAIEVLILGSAVDKTTFYKYMTEQCVSAGKNQGYGFVNTPGNR